MGFTNSSSGDGELDEDDDNCHGNDGDGCGCRYVNRMNTIMMAMASTRKMTMTMLTAALHGEAQNKHNRIEISIQIVHTNEWMLC